MPFGLQPRSGDGAWLDGGTLLVRWNGQEFRYERPTQLPLSGPAGVANALAATAAATVRGVPSDVIAASLRAFEGVPNRLEQVAECDGVRFINDTSATAPVAAAASIRLLADRSGCLALIAGGADKASDFMPLAEAIRDTGVRAVLVDGTGTTRLRASLAELGVETAVPHATFADAFADAVNGVEAPATVALSPGCASFGMFRNEFERGELFRQLSKAWCDRRSPSKADHREP
jgi:UDP-N-acetylmuramoylalanine--D-glutamate ligase